MDFGSDAFAKTVQKSVRKCKYDPTFLQLYKFAFWAGCYIHFSLKHNVNTVIEQVWTEEVLNLCWGTASSSPVIPACA